MTRRSTGLRRTERTTRVTPAAGGRATGRRAAVMRRSCPDDRRRDGIARRGRRWGRGQGQRPSRASVRGGTAPDPIDRSLGWPGAAPAPQAHPDAADRRWGEPGRAPVGARGRRLDRVPAAHLGARAVLPGPRPGSRLRACGHHRHAPGARGDLRLHARVPRREPPGPGGRRRERVGRLPRRRDRGPAVPGRSVPRARGARGRGDRRGPAPPACVHRRRHRHRAPVLGPARPGSSSGRSSSWASPRSRRSSVR